VAAIVWPLNAQLNGSSSSQRKLPHIFFVIVDDFGWAEVGYHRAARAADVRTRHIESLVKEGVELHRHYVHMTCTPSRSSFQSGRLPIHVLTELATACDKNGAIPRNMTGIAAVLKRAGYATHQVGKWDAGMATPHHTPKGRGYDSSLNYFSHANWMYSEAEWLGSYSYRDDVPQPGIIDLWDTDRPARHLNGTGYEEYLFRDRIQHILRTHDQRKPLFLQYDSKIAHYPLQAPTEYQEQFKEILQDNKRVYRAMVSFLDDQLKNITDTMKELGMWENTLMVLSSDNGGFVNPEEGTCNTTMPSPETSGSSLAGSDVGHGTACFNGEAGANNYPLRGGKYSYFEGGIRVNAFISGGFVPKAVRGSRLDGTLHIADWYRTLAEGIAGIDPTDHWAAQSGLPPIDSLNMWPMLSGKNMTSPRDSVGLIVRDNMLIHGRWKYITGGTVLKFAARGGPEYPNATTAHDPIGPHTLTCPASGCLFDVVSDPSEDHEVSSTHPDVVAFMKAELHRQAKSAWSTSHTADPACKTTAYQRYGGFYGPFQEIGETLVDGKQEAFFV